MKELKSYTDVGQSERLRQILSGESSDMYYVRNPLDGCFSHRPLIGRYMETNTDEIPCWSLAALLSVIPKHIKDFNVLRIDIGEKDFSIWYDEIGFGVNNDLPNITMESAVDACYEMIVKSHESNLL